MNFGCAKKNFNLPTLAYYYGYLESRHGILWDPLLQDLLVLLLLGPGLLRLCRLLLHLLELGRRRFLRHLEHVAQRRADDHDLGAPRHAQLAEAHLVLGQALDHDLLHGGRDADHVLPETVYVVVCGYERDFFCFKFGFTDDFILWTRIRFLGIR
jgi:hypothetical protein